MQRFLNRLTPVALVAAACLLVPSGASAQQGIPLIYDDGNGNTLPYRLFLPAGINDPGANFPLVMHLHGAGERGSNNTAQLAFIDGLIQEVQTDHPAILVVPQAPTGSRWEDFSSNDLTEPGRLAMEILQDVEQQYPVDASSRYITGLSMGGFGTWDLVGKNPGYFAAAMPLSAGGQAFRANEYAQSRIWAHHGNADTVTPVAPMRETIDATRQAGGDVIYSEFTGGHGGWRGIYDDVTGENYDWLFDNTAPSLATWTYDPSDGSVVIDANAAPGGEIFSWRFGSTQLNSVSVPDTIFLDGAPVSANDFFLFTDGRFMIYNQPEGQGFSGELRIPNVLPTGLDFVDLMSLHSQWFYFSSETGLDNRRYFDVRLATAIPEPATGLLLMAGVLLAAAPRRVAC